MKMICYWRMLNASFERSGSVCFIRWDVKLFSRTWREGSSIFTECFKMKSRKEVPVSIIIALYE